jgi:hypothetical protein
MVTMDINDLFGVKVLLFLFLLTHPTQSSIKPPINEAEREREVASYLPPQIRTKSFS